MRSSRARELRALVRLTMRTGSEMAGPRIEDLAATEKQIRRAVHVVVKSDIRHGRGVPSHE